LWSNGASVPAIQISDPGIYWLQASNGLCSGTDSLKVDVIPCEIEIEFPNVFTPNADGVNDHFIVTKYKGIANVTLTIFNRWGEQLAHTDNPLQGWNGYYKENICADGTYLWIVKYTTISDEVKALKGFLTLIK
jgi:gliding motility-associated-like protein